MAERQTVTRLGSFVTVALGILVFGGLYLASLYSYLLFHALAELFSVVVAFCIFTLSWNSRQFHENDWFLFLGIAYFFVGLLDLFHTLAYSGMGVFPGGGADLPTQLWIAARYVESLSLLVFPLFFRRNVLPGWVFALYGGITALIFGSLFYWDIFPVCFAEEGGLTPFKKVSEYAISLILLVTLGVLYRSRDKLDAHVFRLLTASVALTVCAELSFTLYSSAYGLANLVGHYLKIVSFYFVHKALVEVGLRNPYALLFRNLKQHEESLHKSEERFRQVAESAQEWIWEVDATGLYTYASSMVETILGYKVEEIVGKKYFYDLFAPDARDEYREIVFETFRQKDSLYGFLNRNEHKNGRAVWLSTSGRPILDRGGALLGYRGVDADVTERMRMDEERTKLISELQDALAEVKTLSGMLPICSACKRIRDDQGYWNQIEAYIHERSAAEFTHSICPECVKELYSDVYEGDE